MSLYRQAAMDNHTEGDYWWFYCYRCEQWAEREGPWCDLYRGEPLTSECVFDENPTWRGGVLFTLDPTTLQPK